jgi:DNA polymerase elongation subunit (family B)
MSNPLNIESKMRKAYSWELKVLGAYVQNPDPGLYGLEDDIIINSSDAAALYPTDTIFSNISSETLFARVYDPNTVSNIINLFKKVFNMKSKGIPIDNIISQVLPSFKNALEVLLKDYGKRYKIKNKADAMYFTLSFYPYLFEKIIRYNGSLEDIFCPKDDETYFLLRSYFFPLVEAISWLSPQNKGYNQMIVDYIFEPDLFEKRYSNKDLYIFDNYHSTKLNFRIISKEEMEEKYFSKYLLNPYGSLFYTHDEKLAFEVDLIIQGLADRRKVKNKMLVIDAICAKIDMAESLKTLFLREDKSSSNINFLTEEQAIKILDEIQDDQNRAKKLESLTDIDFENVSFNNYDALVKYFNKLKEQLNSLQNGIKVSLNSGYGILGMPTYEFSDTIAANSITTAGKIFGIKTFQAVSAWVMEKHEKRLADCTEADEWKADDWVDLELRTLDDYTT